MRRRLGQGGRWRLKTPAPWAGECEIESFTGRAREPRVRTAWAQAGCGIGFNTQIAVGAGPQRSEGELTTVAALTGKTFLRALTDQQAGFALAYTLSGAKPRSDSFGHESVRVTELKGVVTVPYGAWLLHGNLGSQRSHVENSSTSLYALALERSGAFGPVDLMAEVFGDDRSVAWVQFGVRWAVIPEQLFIDGSWGVQTDSQRPTQMTVGFKLAF